EDGAGESDLGFSKWADKLRGGAPGICGVDSNVIDNDLLCTAALAVFSGVECECCEPRTVQFGISWVVGLGWLDCG
uniref:Uncharacterized protein n=1 Tax=Aegilops tauschii subsp. strangulata TaxID=200361 RepID=A0A453B4C6_AEGTS